MGEEQISRRDAGELAACFAVHQRELLGFACVLAHGDRAMAEDLVQAGFEAAARAWATLRWLAEKQRGAWLRTTIANIAVSGFRREAAWLARLPWIEARYRKAPVDVAALVDDSILLERCWKIVKSMPERRQAVAMLRWLLGMKLAEIAAALGMTEKTVSVHLTHARRQLIAELGPDYPVTSDHGEGRAPSPAMTGKDERHD